MIACAASTSWERQAFSTDQIAVVSGTIPDNLDDHFREKAMNPQCGVYLTYCSRVMAQMLHRIGQEMVTERRRHGTADVPRKY
jgi:hypothetical protein